RDDDLAIGIAGEAVVSLHLASDLAAQLVDALVLGVHARPEAGTKSMDGRFEDLVRRGKLADALPEVHSAGRDAGARHGADRRLDESVDAGCELSQGADLRPPRSIEYA